VDDPKSYDQMKIQKSARIDSAVARPPSAQNLPPGPEGLCGSGNVGAGLVFAYVILSALHGVFVSSRVRAGWDTFALLFFSFAIVVVFFGVAALRNHQSFKKRLVADRKLVVWINLASVVMWVSYYLGLKQAVSPAMFAAIALGGGPVYLLIWQFLEERVRPSPRQWARAMLFALGGIALFASDVFKVPSSYLALSGVLAVVCGFGVIWYTKVSRSLAARGWAATEAASVRFWLLVLFAGFAWLSSGNPASSKPLPQMLQDLGVSSVLGQIVPLYGLQKGIQLCQDRYRIALMMALTPLVMFALQFMFNISFSVWSVVGIALIVISQIIPESKKP
jgi:drug/metabolite transporter (DMT)-like permease